LGDAQVVVEPLELEQSALEPPPPEQPPLLPPEQSPRPVAQLEMGLIQVPTVMFKKSFTKLQLEGTKVPMLKQH
jgi:hypothetical protein